MRFFRPALADALLYVPGRNRTIGADVVGLAVSHLAKYRPPIFIEFS